MIFFNNGTPVDYTNQIKLTVAVIFCPADTITPRALYTNYGFYTSAPRRILIINIPDIDSDSVS